MCIETERLRKRACKLKILCGNAGEINGVSQIEGIKLKLRYFY